MKIDQTTQLTGTQLLNETRGNVSKKASSAADDDVQLSSLASQLLASDNETSFDAGRVSEIKQAIADGKFSIDAGAIADRLIDSAKELVSARQTS